MKRGFTVPTPGMRVDARRLSYCEMVWEARKGENVAGLR